MAVVMLRGVLHGAGAESTLTAATINLVLFSAVGLVLGTLAQSTVDEAVRVELEKQIAAAEANREVRQEQPTPAAGQ